MAIITNTLVLATLDAINTAANAGAGAALLRVYQSSGTPPATLGDAVNGTLLAELTMSDPAFAAAVDTTPGGSITASAITDDGSANATGTPDYCRIVDSNLVDVLQTTAGVGSGEANFLTSITAGQPVQVTSVVLTLAEG